MLTHSDFFLGLVGLIASSVEISTPEASAGNVPVRAFLPFAHTEALRARCPALFGVSQRTAACDSLGRGFYGHAYGHGSDSYTLALDREVAA